MADDRDALELALQQSSRIRRPGGDLGGILGRSADETAGAVAALGSIWCHGLAIKPGKPTLLAELQWCSGPRAAGQPAVRARGLPNDRNAARLAIGRVRDTPAGTEHSARLARDVPSAAGRLDIIQVAVRDGLAEPLFGPSALLSVLTRADGYIVVPEPATGIDGGTAVEVILYR